MEAVLNINTRQFQQLAQPEISARPRNEMFNRL